MKLLTKADVNDIFGKVEPPKGMSFGADNPEQGFSNLVGFGINMFIVVAGLFLLLYLLWGAYDWITSSGEKEKITKAQNKITNAVIGFILIFIVIVVYRLLLGNILKIIEVTPDGWKFKLPSLQP